MRRIVVRRSKLDVRKVSAALGLLLISAFAVACGGGGGSSGESKIAVIVPYPGDPYWGAIADGATAEAKRLGNVDLVLGGATKDYATDQMLSKIEDAQTQGAEAIAVVPETPDEFLPTLERVANDGIPVIAIDTPIPAFKQQTAFVGTDNEGGGRKAGEYMKQLLPNGGEVGVLHCYPGTEALDRRVAGFEEAIEGSGLEVVSTLDAKCDPERGRALTEDMLTAHPQLAGIFSGADPNALGAVQAIKAAGKQNDVVLVSFDGTPDGIKAVQNGEIAGDVAQFPVRMGEDAVSTAVAAAQGDQVPKVVDTGAKLITKANAAQFLKQQQK
jgi:ABC-type sugar transport system substrate-binding protein